MLKRFAVLMMIAAPVGAQNPPAGMPSEADMQRMMQQGQKMAACMAEIDQSRVEAISREAEAVGNEIDALCKQGDEEGALDVALAFGKKMATDPTVRKIQECSAGMRNMMAGMLPDLDPAGSAEERGGICN